MLELSIGCGAALRERRPYVAPTPAFLLDGVKSMVERTEAGLCSNDKRRCEKIGIGEVLVSAVQEAPPPVSSLS